MNKQIKLLNYYAGVIQVCRLQQNGFPQGVQNKKGYL